MIYRRHPDWLKVKFPSGKNYQRIKGLLRNKSLHTVCEEANCPNISECFNSGTATFMILGNICTRNCRYCNVDHGIPEKVDRNEPLEISSMVEELGLDYAVITSVTRDDLDDKGSGQFASTIKEIREKKADCRVEVLIPDFNGDEKLLIKVIEARPFIINHNIEVVKGLFPTARPEGNYLLSLRLLKSIKKLNNHNNNILSKSGLMIGLGETKEDIIETLEDLRKAGVDILTIGQYLSPSRKHLPIRKYYTPAEFEELKETALKLGFRKVFSGPLVRSSYHAADLV